MQLIIFSSKHIVPVKEASQGNDELRLTTTKLSKAAKLGLKDKSFTLITEVTVDTPFHKKKDSIDAEVMGHLKKQFNSSLSSVADNPDLHRTLQVYAHGSTFGLGFESRKEEGVKLLPEHL